MSADQLSNVSLWLEGNMQLGEEVSTFDKPPITHGAPVEHIGKGIKPPTIESFVEGLDRLASDYNDKGWNIEKFSGSSLYSAKHIKEHATYEFSKDLSLALAPEKRYKCILNATFPATSDLFNPHTESSTDYFVDGVEIRNGSFRESYNGKQRMPSPESGYSNYAEFIDEEKRNQPHDVSSRLEYHRLEVPKLERELAQDVEDVFRTTAER